MGKGDRRRQESGVPGGPAGKTASRVTGQGDMPVLRLRKYERGTGRTHDGAVGGMVS